MPTPKVQFKYKRVTDTGNANMRDMIMTISKIGPFETRLDRVYSDHSVPIRDFLTQLKKDAIAKFQTEVEEYDRQEDITKACEEFCDKEDRGHVWEEIAKEKKEKDKKQLIKATVEDSKEILEELE